MGPTFEVQRATYLDIEDTIEEVDISRRQLSHWQDQGLLTPERGENANKFTSKDIKRLKVLRHLIVDQRLPISFVKEIIDGGLEFTVNLIQQFVESGAVLSDQSSVLSGKFFDFDNSAIVEKQVVASETWNTFGATASENQIEERLYALALLLFRLVRVYARHPAAFQARQDEIIQRIFDMARFARVVFVATEDGRRYLRMRPSLEGEEKLPAGVEPFSFAEAHGRLALFRDTAQKLHESGNPGASDWLDRFWNDETDEFIREYKVPF